MELYQYSSPLKWNIKTWKLNERDKMISWIEKYSKKYQIREIFVCNGYGVEWKGLKIIE